MRLFLIGLCFAFLCGSPVALLAGSTAVMVAELTISPASVSSIEFDFEPELLQVVETVFPGTVVVVDGVTPQLEPDIQVVQLRDSATESVQASFLHHDQTRVEITIY